MRVSFLVDARCRAAVVLLIVLGAAGLASCAARGAHPQSPQQTLRAYARALDEGRVEDAYKLLSDEAKRELSFEAFGRMVRENPAEMRDILQSLARPASDPVVTARITTPDGQSLRLVYESGRWKIDRSAIELYSQATPEKALESFVRAYERKRYDVLMRFVPEAERAGLDAAKLQAAWEGPLKHDTERAVQAIKSALPGASFEIVGDRASMPYGALGAVQLVREHGDWRIEDFD